MKAIATLLVIAFSLAPPTAWSATITISFDESLLNPKTPNGVSFNSGVLVLCEQFNVAGTATCSGNNVSDVVQFAGGNIITYNSDVQSGELPKPGTAEVGIPTPLPNFGAGQRFVLETVNEAGNEVIRYNPTPNDQAAPWWRLILTSTRSPAMSPVAMCLNP
jgi:hypothetical protein